MVLAVATQATGAGLATDLEKNAFIIIHEDQVALSYAPWRPDAMPMQYRCFLRDRQNKETTKLWQLHALDITKRFSWQAKSVNGTERDEEHKENNGHKRMKLYCKLA